MQPSDHNVDDGPFFFLHVRKTAGTTLVTRLRRNFPGDQWYPEDDDRPAMIEAKVSPELLLAQSPARLASIRFYSLHQPLWVRDRLAVRLGVRPYTFTVLRDPVERTLSHLKQLAQVSQWTGALIDFYRVPRVRNWICWNHQVLQFVQTQADAERMAPQLAALYEAPNPDTYEIGPPLDLGPDELARAKAALETIDAVGFTENVNEFVDGLAAAFGWQAGPGVRANVAAPVEVPAELRALIEADSAPDLEFYAHARGVVNATQEHRAALCETAHVREQPSGEVTFLFTDVEGSTRLWAEHQAAMEPALERHDVVLRDTIENAGGYVFSLAGDSFAAAFPAPAPAVAAAVDAQRRLDAEQWDGLPDGLRVRMGLHVGTGQERAGNYFGPDVNLAARVMSAAWGGQILCTEAVATGAGVPVAALGEHGLRDVDRRIALYQVTVVGSRAAFPPPRTLDVTPSSLPAQRSSFVGREHDVASVRRMFLDARLVTLTGAGGSGKTRLAIEIAGREQPHHPDGTFFADLTSVGETEHVAAAVARSCLVTLDASGPAIDQLTDALSPRRCLLLLDNCEHVIDASSDLVDRVLAACPGVVVLATSRESLGLAGEHLHVVGPLETGPGSEATKLFLERAIAAGGAGLDADIDTIAEVCERLDGIPLAIELAASRARTMSPPEILDRLDRQLDVLSGGRRRGPDRHQTLRATIAWSYDLLDDRERALFDQLAVFAGSFDLAAAARVAGGADTATDDTLADLVAKSMVDTSRAVSGQRRYRLLRSLQAFADERLDEPARATAIAAHARHYLGRVVDLPPSRHIARALWLELEPDLDELLLALERAEEGNDANLRDLAHRATEPLSHVLTSRGLFEEARRRCVAALASDVAETLRGRLLVARAFMEATQDGASDYRELAGEALPLLHAGDGVWSAALGLMSIPEQMFLPEVAIVPLDDALARLEGLTGGNADHDRAMLEFYRAGTLMSLRDYVRAEHASRRSAEILATIEPTSLLRVWAASSAAMSATMLDRADEAVGWLDEVSALADWTDWCADWFFARAVALARLGDIAGARHALEAIGGRFARADASPMVGTIVAGYGIVAHLGGDDARAQELFEPLGWTRAPASTALLYEAIAEVDGWVPDVFATRRLERVASRAIEEEGRPRSEFFESLRRLLGQELAGAPG